MSEILTTEQVEEILAGCEGVTPGPWVIHPESPYTPYDNTGWSLLTDSDNAGLVAAHIARLDPQTVSSLATELLALRKRVGDAHLLAASIRDRQPAGNPSRLDAQRILELTRPSEQGTANNAPLPTHKEPS